MGHMALPDPVPTGVCMNRHSPQEAHLLVLGIVVRHYLGRRHADLHAVHQELPRLLQGLFLTLRLLHVAAGGGGAKGREFKLNLNGQ